MNTEIKNFQDQRQGEAGFSLVELAIVLIIIGLIVGGVLKGQDLIESARVNSIQTQLNEVRVAAGTFLTKYDDMPGDLTNVALVDATLSAGNGNGRVGGTGVARIADAPDDSESVSFWQHLRASTLLGGVTAVTGASNMALSDSLQSRVGGGFSVNYETVQGDTAHWFLLGEVSTAGAATVNDGSVLSPVQARGIDEKSDDGDPQAGNIQAATGDDAAAATDCVTAAGDYATGGTSDSSVCVSYFKF